MGFEGILIALIAACIGGVIAGLITAHKARPGSRPPAKSAVVGSTPLRTKHLSSEITVASPARAMDHRTEFGSFAISDPRNPSQTAIVEFIPESAAELLGNAEARVDTDGGSYGYGFAYDAIISSLPKVAVAAEQVTGQVMRVVGYSGNLGEGALEHVAANGNVLGTMKDVATGQFAGQLQFATPGLTAISPASGALLIFQAMAVVTAQYYLHRIDAELATINKSLDRIEARLVGMTRSNVEVAREMTERVFRLMRAGEELTASDLDQLREAEQLARLAFHQSRAALITAADNWNRALKDGDAGKKNFREALEEGLNARANDASILVYASAVLGRIALLRAIAESSGNFRRQNVLMEDYGELRQLLKKQMSDVIKAYAPFKMSVDKADEQFGGMFGLRDKDKTQFGSLKAAISELKKDVTMADSLLPEPTEMRPVSSTIEIRRLANGETEVYSAVTRALVGPEKPTATKKTTAAKRSKAARAGSTR